jgi:hypothetical protein
VLGTNKHPNTAGLVYALATAPVKPNVPDISKLLSVDVPGIGGVVFRPDSPPKVDGSQVSNSYTAQSVFGKFVGLGYALISDQGSAILFSAFGPENDKEYLQGVLSGLIASARFTAPNAAQLDGWIRTLTGSTFCMDRASFTPGMGTGTGNPGPSSSSSDNTFLEFCPNMAFNYRSVGFVDGGGGTSDYDHKKSGSWGVAMELVGTNAVLIPNDGSAWLTYRLDLVGETVTFNGRDSIRFVANGCGG